MSILTVVLSVWAFVALCAIFFIRGATQRHVRAMPTQPQLPAPRTGNAQVAIAK